LVKNYKSKESYKKLSDQMKEYIDNFFDSDSNYIAVNIKTSTNAPVPGNNDNRGDEFTVEVARQTAPGRYENQGKVTVSGDLLEVIDYGVNQKPVDPKTRGDNKVQIDPVEPEENEEQQQTMTQQGDSLKSLIFQTQDRILRFLHHQLHHLQLLKRVTHLSIYH
jgi:hypothetical protein